MDIFTRFNRKSIDDRHVDTLIGLAKGITADGKVDQLEAEFLQNWLAQSYQTTSHPVIVNLLNHVRVVLADGVLDSQESNELFDLLRKITGEPSALGEIGKPSTLPLDNPAPRVLFQNKSFLFTGTCAFGTRSQCHLATESLGGQVLPGVSRKLDYLVIGSYVTDSWAHETFGRKIEKAMQYRDSGIPIAIVTEEHWADCGGIHV